jgi:peptide/nickel transport system permease protein
VHRYIIRRLVFLVPIVIALSITVFVALRLMPGDIAELMLGQSATPEALTEARHELGLDQPVMKQYLTWVKEMLTGDLGDSIILGTSVGAEIKDRLPITLEILVLTVLFSTVLGVAFGVVSAVFQNSPIDYFARTTSVFGLSIPHWWFGIMLLLIPAVLWSYSPPVRYVSPGADLWDNLRQFVPPAFVLGSASSAVIMRLSRSTLLEVLRQDYIRTARAKGLRARVVVSRHALRNAMIPIITVLGGEVAGLMGGTVIIEQVFGLQGLGQYLYQATLQRDYPVIQVMTLYIAVIVVLMHLLVDLTYAWLDPRIRYT